MLAHKNMRKAWSMETLVRALLTLKYDPPTTNQYISSVSTTLVSSRGVKEEIPLVCLETWLLSTPLFPEIHEAQMMGSEQGVLADIELCLQKDSCRESPVYKT